jgi:hypothetical protein
MFLISYRRRMRTAALMAEIVIEEGRSETKRGRSADQRIRMSAVVTARIWEPVRAKRRW